MWNKRFSKDDNSFMISCVPSIALLITAFYAGRHNTTPQKNVILDPAAYFANPSPG